ncbi:MAG TPA: hypothetical protein ACFYEL_00245 [Candidatus Wunengus californicus]
MAAAPSTGGMTGNIPERISDSATVAGMTKNWLYGILFLY